MREAMISTDMPGYDVFKTEISRIYPEGDLQRSYEKIRWYIENEKFCADGTAITYRLIMDKYASHIKQWNLKYQKKERDGFLSKEAEEKRKTLYDFLSMKYYEREFIITNTSSERDKYIFGSFSIQYLMAQLKSFKSQFNNGQETHKKET